MERRRESNYCIVGDPLWQPGVWKAPRSLSSWGPAPSPSFLAPQVLAALMTGAPQAR